ncbi:MAG: RDD family protein [Candidatus Caenarcaniphilales bacterium]|nr:RDD family protein [Candidatus Caenarcaniphilales bacterium]
MYNNLRNMIKSYDSQWKESEKNIESENHGCIFQYAGFWRRFLAYIIDFFILTLLKLSLTLTTFYIIFKAFDIQLNAGLISATFWILGPVYFVLMESGPKQATLGKIASGLKVTNLDGNRISISRAIGRYFGKYISLIFFIGYFMMLFSPKKQCLHDMMSSCLVIRKNQ